jgi:hypothetical protein
MKKAVAKELRKTAQSLPTLYYERLHGVKVSGGELLMEAAKAKEDGKTPPPMPEGVTHAAVYVRRQVVQAPVNHYNNLKKGYKKMGWAVVGAYTKAVQQVLEHQENLRKLHEEHQKTLSNEQPATTPEQGEHQGD